MVDFLKQTLVLNTATIYSLSAYLFINKDTILSQDLIGMLLIDISLLIMIIASFKKEKQNA